MERVAHWIDTMEILASEFLIDDSHLRRSYPVLIVEFPTRQETDAHGLEVTRTRTVEPGLFVAARSRRVVRADAVVPTASAYGSEPYLCRRDHSWYG